MSKTSNTHTEYVTFIAFQLQQWLHERASTLRHTTLSVLLTVKPDGAYSKP
jgi:Uma2 family endonuclease